MLLPRLLLLHLSPVTPFIVITLLNEVVGNCYQNRYPDLFTYEVCNRTSKDDLCLLELHINTTTNQPLYVERLCMVHDPGEFFLPCSTTDFHDDLLETCCSEDFCNLCPNQEIVDYLSPEHRDELYKLFPDECSPTTEPSTAVPIITPIQTYTPSSFVSHKTPSLHHTSTFTSSQATASNSIVISSPAPTPSSNNKFVMFIFTGIVVMVAIITVILFLFAILFCVYVTRKGRRRRVVRANDPPFTTNPGFNEMGDMSSNALSGTQLLQSRTWAHDFRLCSLIGTGRFGSVHKGTNGTNVIAVKVYNTFHEREWEREVSIYNTPLLTDPNVLKFIFSDKMEAHDAPIIELWTGLEYHANGNLQEYLKQKSKGVTIKEAYILSTSFLNGVSFLHRSISSGQDTKPGIAHRDLKSPNVLVKADGTTCIGDLGLAVKQVGMGVDIIPENKLSGTRRYLAPEILNESMDFHKFQSYVCSDIYSSSLVLWEIFNCAGDDASSYQQPFYEYVSNAPDIDDMKRIIVEEKCRPPLKRFENIEELSFLCKLLSEAWNESPLSRPSALNISKKIRSVLESRIN